MELTASFVDGLNQFSPGNISRLGFVLLLLDWTPTPGNVPAIFYIPFCSRRKKTFDELDPKSNYLPGLDITHNFYDFQAKKVRRKCPQILPFCHAIDFGHKSNEKKSKRNFLEAHTKTLISMLGFYRIRHIEFPCSFFLELKQKSKIFFY